MKLGGCMTLPTRPRRYCNPASLVLKMSAPDSRGSICEGEGDRRPNSQPGPSPTFCEQCNTHFTLKRASYCLGVSGAGDAFVGSFAHYISALTLEQRDDSDAIRDVIRKACAVATFSVQRQGTQASYPHPSDLIAASLNTLSLQK